MSPYTQSSDEKSSEPRDDINRAFNQFTVSASTGAIPVSTSAPAVPDFNSSVALNDLAMPWRKDYLKHKLSKRSTENMLLRSIETQNRLDLILDILYMGAKLSVQEESELAEAILKGHVEAVQYLLSKGQNEYAVAYDAAKKLVLCHAIKANRLDLILESVKLGSDIWTDDCMVLRLVAENGDSEGLDFLIEEFHKFQLQPIIYLTCDQFYFSARNFALEKAAGKDRLDQVKVLLEMGADIRHDDNVTLNRAVSKWSPRNG